MKNVEFDPEIEFRPFDLDDLNGLAKLETWSGQGDMIPLSAQGIAHHHLSTGAYVFGELVGYGAITVVYSAKVIEFGGLVVDPGKRGLHIGSAIIKKVVGQAAEEFEPDLILAFSSPRSARLFSRLGGNSIDDANTLPSEVWKLCHICPQYQKAQDLGKVCCERAFDITHIVTD